MQFPGFCFPSDTEIYPAHDVVWKYLDSYAEHFKVKDIIKYHHLVEKVHLLPNKKWQITVTDMSNAKLQENSTYDAVFVCTNKFSSPLIPKIDGIDEFNGKKLHSRDYRKPEAFSGMSPINIDLFSNSIRIYIK